jgi:mannose-6-phosphate isomerase-like protein (cupin superfamily)
MNKIDLASALARFSDHWNPRIVGNYNGNEIRVAKVSGEFTWHSHNDTDEMFLVISGELKIAFRDRVVSLSPGEMIVVPKGMEHKPMADEEACILLMDREGELNTGGQPSQYTRTKLEKLT